MNVGSYIESIGAKLPAKKVSSQYIIDQMKISPKLKLELISGIKERRHCTNKEDAVSIAIDAAKDCLKYSSIKPSDIDMIIYCGISRFDYKQNFIYEPSLSTQIKLELGIPNALSFDISNACAGMVTAVDIANNFIQREIVKNCMVVSGEYISPICQHAIHNIESATSPELASLTVGDAGLATILEKTSNEEGFEVLDLETFGQYSKLCIAKLSNKYPGGQMFTQMNKLHKISINKAPDFVEKCLKKNGLNYRDIDYLIPHQTAKRAITTGAKKFQDYFGIAPIEIINNLERFGNTASTTHFLALYLLLKEKKFVKSDRILLLSFASGLVLGVIVFKINALANKYGQ